MPTPQNQLARLASSNSETSTELGGLLELAVDRRGIQALEETITANIQIKAQILSGIPMSNATNNIWPPIGVLDPATGLPPVFTGVVSMSATGPPNRKVLGSDSGAMVGGGSRIGQQTLDFEWGSVNVNTGNPMFGTLGF